jgi:hypothetical protein
MDPRTAGKLGGRKSFIQTALERAGTDPAQQKLQFRGTLQLSGSTSSVRSGAKSVINVGSVNNVTVINVIGNNGANTSQEVVLIEEESKSQKSSAAGIGEIMVLSEDDEKKVGIKRERSESPTTRRVKKEEKVGKEQGYDCYQQHRNAVSDQLRKAEEDKNDVVKKILQGELERIKKVWKGTCTELPDEDLEDDKPIVISKSVAMLEKGPTESDDVKVSTVTTKDKRSSYTEAQRQFCVDKLAEVMNSADSRKRSQAEALRQINAVSGYSHISRAHLERWTKDGGVIPKSAGGRIVNREFDAAVYDKLILQGLNAEGEKVTTANCAYSYDIISKAAKETRKDVKWKDDPKLPDASKGFTKTWVARFLKDMDMTKRRITHDEKRSIPSDEEIFSTMNIIHEKIKNGGWKDGDQGQPEPYPLNRIINCDETATYLTPHLKNQYVEKGVDRASAFGSEDKRRFTTNIGHPVQLGAGEKPPSTFNILGCHVKHATRSEMDDEPDEELDTNSTKKMLGLKKSVT